MAGPCEIRRVELQVAEDKRVTPNSCRNPTNLRYLLSNSERLHLGLYETLWEEQFMTPACDDPNAIFHLGDNPLQRMSWSANGKIPAFRKSSGRYWHAASHRWLTDNERLACLGWPVYLGMACAAQCPVVRLDSPVARSMAGNAWHASNASIVLIVAWSCVKTIPPWSP